MHDAMLQAMQRSMLSGLYKEVVAESFSYHHYPRPHGIPCYDGSRRCGSSLSDTTEGRESHQLLGRGTMAAYGAIRATTKRRLIVGWNLEGFDCISQRIRRQQMALKMPSGWQGSKGDWNGARGGLLGCMQPTRKAGFSKSSPTWQESRSMG